jgi:pimeloyl-ACP methyl ester carboxylesterase
MRGSPIGAGARSLPPAASAAGDNRSVEIERWWADGARVPVAFSGGERSIFVRRMGAGPPMTLLHGFPSSSYDWAKVAPALAERHTLVLLDFLGFGASEKPTDHEYSLHEQADLVEAVWAHERIGQTILVGHDYAVSVAQELLARGAEGRLAVQLRAVHLLNGGLYPDLHRRQPTQQLLLDPEQGPRIGELLDEQMFAAGLDPTFAESYDAGADSAAMWRAMARDGGQRIGHLLARYMIDRERHEARWVQALESSDVPRAFIWGMLDPISGAHMAQRISERVPQAPLLALGDVAHWPQLEAPTRVARALLADALPRD